jgi:hypothetical protein
MHACLALICRADPEWQNLWRTLARPFRFLASKLFPSNMVLRATQAFLFSPVIWRKKETPIIWLVCGYKGNEKGKGVSALNQ